MSYFSRGGGIRLNATDAQQLTLVANAAVASALANVSVTSTNWSDFQGFDVFLLLGQSNMVGCAGLARNDILDYTSPNILQWGQSASLGTNETPCLATDPLQHVSTDGTGSSIGMSFARLYESNLRPGRKVLLVPCAYSGVGFSASMGAATSPGNESVVLQLNINVAGNLVDLAIKRLNRAMAYHPITNPTPAYSGNTPPEACPLNDFKGILWHQGEHDIAQGMSEANYKSNLQAVVAQVRARVSGASDKTVFIAGLPTASFRAQYPTGGAWAVLPQVGNVEYFQLANCAFASSLVPTVLGEANFAHFSNDGCRKYGARYYEQFLRLTEGVPAVSNVRANVSTFSQGIQLSWDRTSPTFATILALSTGSTQVATYISYSVNLSIPAAQLTPSSSYTLQLTPMTRSGIKGNSVPAAVLTPPPGEPPIPQVSTLATSAGASFADGITVSWTAANTSHVQVAYRLTSVGTYTVHGNTSASSVVIPSIALQPSAQYVVRTVPYFNQTAGSEATSTVTTLALPSPIIANFQVTINSFIGSVACSWTPTNVTHTKLFYGLGASPGSYTECANATSNTATILNVLQPSTAYTIKAVPYNQGVVGSEATTQVTTPNTPTGIIMAVQYGASTVPIVDALGNSLTSYRTPAMVTVSPRGYVLHTNVGSVMSSVNLPASYTKSAWLYPTETNGQIWGLDRQYHALGSVSPTRTGMTNLVGLHYMYMYLGKITVGHVGPDNTQRTLADPTAILANLWVHFAVTYDNSTTTLKLYRNGTQVASSTNPGYAWTGGEPVSMGSHWQPYIEEGEWKGYVDDVRVYNRALSAAEVANVYSY